MQKNYNILFYLMMLRYLINLISNFNIKNKKKEDEYYKIVREIRENECYYESD